MHPNPAPISAQYFDGLTAQSHTVDLHIAEGMLHIAGDGIAVQVPLGEVQWPERTRHGLRVAHLAKGGKVQSAQSAEWDRWVRTYAQPESWVVRAQQSWRGAAVGVALLLALCWVGYVWGLPLAARAVVAVTPRTVDAALGEATLQAIDGQLMLPSQLSPAEQTRIAQALRKHLATLPPGSLPDWKLVFRKSRIGPNALALPDGTMILTDELVELVNGDEQVITGVLAHELGHVQHRHGMRMVVQASVVGSVSSLVLGDFSSVLAAVPVLLGHAHYSREAEHEADEHAVKVLKAAGISPAVMVTLFEKLAQERGDAAPQEDAEDANDTSGKGGTAFASHPSDAARIAYFKAQAQKP